MLRSGVHGGVCMVRQRGSDSEGGAMCTHVTSLVVTMPMHMVHDNERGAVCTWRL